MNNQKTIKEMFKEKINYDEIYDKVMNKVTPTTKKVPALKYIAMPAIITAAVCGGITYAVIKKVKEQ